jgi:hypothetical protein
VRKDGDSAARNASLAICCRVDFAEISNNSFDTKSFLERIAAVFVKSKEWIVQLKRNTSTVANFICEIHTEIATVDVFPQSQEQTIDACLIYRQERRCAAQIASRGNLPKNFSCQISKNKFKSQI